MTLWPTWSLSQQHLVASTLPIIGGDGSGERGHARHSHSKIEQMYQAGCCSSEGLRTEAVTGKIHSLALGRKVIHVLPSGL